MENDFFKVLKKENWVELLEKHLKPDEKGNHCTNSIMNSDIICECDDDFMCEHRSEIVIDFIKENTK